MLKSEITSETAGSSRIIVSGIHLQLTPALRQAAESRAGRLMRRDRRVARVRIDLEVDRTRAVPEQFIAKGRLEISGPDLIARVASDNAYKSIDLLGAKFEELLRRRRQKRVNTRNDARHQTAKTLAALNG